MLKAKEHAPLDDLNLPFIKDSPDWKPGKSERGPRCFWSVKTTGDVQADCELGKEYARALLDHMLRTRCGPLLGWVAFAMADDPRFYEGEEKMIMVGFMAEIARNAMYGRHIIKAAGEMGDGGMLVLRNEEREEETAKVDGIAPPPPLPSVEIRTPIPARRQ